MTKETQARKNADIELGGALAQAEVILVSLRDIRQVAGNDAPDRELNRLVARATGLVTDTKAVRDRMDESTVCELVPMLAALMVRCDQVLTSTQEIRVALSYGTYTEGLVEKATVMVRLAYKALQWTNQAMVALVPVAIDEDVEEWDSEGGAA